MLSTSQSRSGVDALGPTRGDVHWQAREQSGFEGHQSRIQWEAQRAIRPQRHTSREWTSSKDQLPPQLEK